MPLDLTKQEERKSLISQIRGSENKGRRALSRRQVEIYNDKLYQHVWERVARRFSVKTATQSPLVQSINLSRRIVNQEASIYKEPPARTFTDVSEMQEEDIRRLYDWMMFDAKMMQSNKSFKLQRQNHVMIVPHEGKLKMRVLRNHHIDKIDDENDPERAFGYVISTFDMDFFQENRRSDANQGNGFRGRYDSFIDQKSNTVNEDIGDDEDYQLSLQRFVVWTRELNFIMDGHGNILTEDMESPIPGVLPIVDISNEKDFAYWVTDGDPLGEFTLDFNTTLTDISNIVMMQGYAQSYLIAKDDLIPDNIQLGPNFILKLPVDNPDDPRPEFGFANPNSDIAGAINYAETLLSMFLSSRGIDPKSITGRAEQNKFTSGIERLLSMMDQFTASKSDFDIYAKAEKDIYEIIKAWYNVSVGNNFFIDPMLIHGAIPEMSTVELKFNGPEMIQTEEDKTRVWRDKIEMGAASRVEMIMDMRNVEREEALEIVKQIDEDEILAGAKEALEEMAGDPESSEGDEPLEPQVSAGAAEAEERKRVALNGAQVTAILTIVQEVAAGKLPREAAINLIITSFNLSREEAEAVLGEAGLSFNVQEEKKPNPFTKDKDKE